MKISQDLKEWIIDIVLAFVIAGVILFFIRPTIVHEHSMEKSLYNGDYLIVSKQSYNLFGGEPKRGDIIVFSSHLETVEGKDKLLIKRVIGVPGDEVSITGGFVYVNGEKLQEDAYTRDGYTASEMDPVTVPEGHLFCLGDNRQNSTDSRDSRVGFVPEETIMGKAVFRLYPFSSFGKL